MINEMLNFINDNVFAVITAVISIIALFQTRNQIKISNKQYLFDRRIRIYTILIGLINLYKENESLLKNNHKLDEAIEVESLFYGLINNSFLEELHFAIAHPLEQPYQHNFLVKLEELTFTANEIKFVYGGYKDICKFIIDYKDVLHSIYKYQIVQNKMISNAQKLEKTYEQIQKEFNEPLHRNKLMRSYNNLISSYEKMREEKSIEKIEKLIKL